MALIEEEEAWLNQQLACTRVKTKITTSRTFHQELWLRQQM